MNDTSHPEHAAPDNTELQQDPRLEDDRAAQQGLPPDFGPEERVLLVRPSFFRASPIKSLGLVLLGPVAAVLAYMIPEADKLTWALKVLGIVGVPAMVLLTVWWLFVVRGRAIEITNKRTVERRGLFSRSLDEVLHDHVRNINVEQSFYERIVNIGRVGIASSGQADIEIEMRDLPNPDRVREIIDLYRPLG